MIYGRIKAVFAAFAFAAAVIFIAPADATAQTAHSNCDPKCPNAVCEKIQNHSNAMRSRDEGTTRNTVVQNDSAHQLSCFDQGMIETSQAGQIFSDPHWASPISPLKPGGPTLYLPIYGATGSFAQYAWDATVMGPAGPGSTDTLAVDLETVIQGTLEDMLSNFTQSLTGLVWGLLGSTVSGLLSMIQAFFVVPTGWPFPQIIDWAITNILGISFDCTVMQELWDDIIIGQGVNVGNVFSSFDELFQLKGALPGAGPLMSTLFGAGPGDMEWDQLEAAWQDLQDLNNPGNPTDILWFKTPPVLPAGSTVNFIIGNM